MTAAPTAALPVVGNDPTAAPEATPEAQGAPATPALPALERVPFWKGPFARRTWREQGYLATLLVTGIIGLAWFVLTISLIPSLAVTVVGLFVGGGLVVGARGWGAMHRSLARSMLRHEVATPPPFRRGHGFWRSLGSMLRDATGWRALAFMLVEFALGLTAFIVSASFLITSLGMMTHWYWSQWLPAQQAADGTWHRGSQLGPDVFVEGWAWNLAYAALGVVLLFVWPRITLAFGRAFRSITTSLLGPTRSSVRLAEVTRTRSIAVADADTRLRQIERDLHDGTQARLVAVAMQLGEARDQLAEGGDTSEALHLVTQAHASAKEAMTELRSISQGIRPASLDAGLVVALETLTARSPIPVTLDAEPNLAASPEVEAIAYYCVAELLTNVAKHANATGAYVLLGTRGSEEGSAVGYEPRSLVIRVRDDGVGGARIALPGASGGSGLHGLQQRIAAVDGTVTLDSPVGGPTVATVILPLSAAR